MADWVGRKAQESPCVLIEICRYRFPVSSEFYHRWGMNPILKLCPPNYFDAQWMRFMPDTSGRFAALDRRCLQHLNKLGVQFKHFFDIGASNGAWTRHVCQDFPGATYDLFEPLVDYAPGFRERIESTLAGPQFRVHSVALGAFCGRVTMNLYIPDLPGSSALRMDALPPGFRPMDVEMLTVDHVIESGFAPLPQVIKIDTQGCELEILKGAKRTLPEVAALVLECWLVRDYGKRTPLLLEVADWLRQFDFHLWDFGDQWRNPAGALVTQDCFFLNARCPASRLADEPRFAHAVRGAAQPGGVPGYEFDHQSALEQGLR